MATAMRIVLGLLTFVTLGMIIGALVQLAFIRKLEDTYGTEPTLRGLRGIQHGVNPLARGISHLAYDKEAVILRLGYLEVGTEEEILSSTLHVKGFRRLFDSTDTRRILKVKPEVVSWSPRIILFHNFLSTEECDYLRGIAKPRLKVSTVVDAKTGKGIKSEVRTSSGTFLTPDERSYPIIQAIEKRISVYSQVPVENGELIQVLRYQKSELYRPHHDYFADQFNIKRGGQRIATMLMYLSDNVEGGETYFPMAGSNECSCGGKTVKGLCVKPTKGNAVLFWSMGLDGESDPNSLHGGCQVLSGEKWSATKWMRERTIS